MNSPNPEKVKEIFDRYYPADLKYWTAFSRFLIPRSFEKGEPIKDYYGIERYINILIAGAAGHFVPHEEKDICINLYYENHLFSDYLSFLTQKPTQIKTVALEDTQLWSIRFKDLQKLYQKSSASLAIGKAISEILFIKKQKEQVNLLTLTPTERYKKLIQERPLIFQRTPLKIIASYLGMTPESLSRIRKKIS